MTSPYQHTYMAAMALNNMGVSLLKRQADDEKAIEMLSLAVVLIRAISKGDSLTNSHFLNTVQTKLTEANQRLATCPLSNHLSDFHVITHQDIFDAVLMFRQGNKIASEPLPPVLIQIERIASIMDDEKTYFPGFEFSIVLYNLGTYYLHMASLVGLHDVTKALEKRQCACELFQLSYAVLQTLVHEPIVRNHEDFMIQYPSFMMQVMQSLIHTTSMLGITSPELESFIKTISNLYQSLQGEYNTIKLFPLHTARAA